MQVFLVGKTFTQSSQLGVYELKFFIIDNTSP